jgi:serine/threonine protein kinase
MNEQFADDYQRIEELADSFVDQIRKGEQPTVREFVDRYPELAGRLEKLLPAVALLERHAAVANAENIHASNEPAAAAPPAEIGDFTILCEVGRGGMGVVYEALDKSLGRHVALKVLSLPAVVTPKHLERFRFEARAAAGLQHPHIVPVFGVGEFNGLHYYAMQFIRGQSLQQVVRALRDFDRPAAESQNPPPTPLDRAKLADWDGKASDFFRNVAQIGLQAAEALSYAHREGVLHRDIKPSNLLLDAGGNIWVTDFGLAKLEGSDGLTESGDFVGTLRYMAPERLEGVLDRRSDVYSLGATLYELLTLETFFDAHSQAKLVEQILNESPPAPSRLRRAVPRDLETIVLKAIAKEPAARYRTAEEMAEDLRRYLADRPILARRPTATEQLVRWCRRNRLLATLVGAVAALLVTAVIILTWSNARIRRESMAKDRAMSSASNAVHQLLSRVASQKLDNVPMSHPLRVELLQDAARAYEGLLALGDQDPAIRPQLAETLHTLAGLQRELNRNTEAAAALKRSAAMYESLAATDPKPPAIREALAGVEADLAYTWQFDTTSADRQSFPVEDEYRRALADYEAIEHDWPGRRQPVTLCLRYLADFAFRRGDKVMADQLWLQSISRGEAYLQQHPDKFQVQNDLCWACIEYYELLLSRSPDRAKNAETILAKGVEHASRMKRESPQSNQAADVLAALHIRQAMVQYHAGRIDEAIPMLQRAISEIHELCEAVPWNTDYWNSAQWFHQIAIQELNQAKRKDELNACIEKTTEWFGKVRAELSGDAMVARKLREATASFAKALRSVGLNEQADALLSYDR